jgi:hypothetical protein
MGPTLDLGWIVFHHLGISGLKRRSAERGLA